MITSLVSMYEKGAITSDHFVAQCIHMIDPDDPGLVLHWSLHKSHLISGYRVKIGIKLHEVSVCRSDNAINRRKP